MKTKQRVTSFLWSHSNWSLQRWCKSMCREALREYVGVFFFLFFYLFFLAFCFVIFLFQTWNNTWTVLSVKPFWKVSAVEQHVSTWSLQRFGLTLTCTRSHFVPRSGVNASIHGEMLTKQRMYIDILQSNPFFVTRLFQQFCVIFLSSENVH